MKNDEKTSQILLLVYLLLSLLIRSRFAPCVLSEIEFPSFLDCCILVFLLYLEMTSLAAIATIPNCNVLIPGLAILISLLAFTMGWEILRSILIFVQGIRLFIPVSPRPHNQARQECKCETSKAPNLSAFDFLQQAYFLCRQVPIGVCPCFTLGYQNTYASEMLIALGFSFKELCYNLSEIESSRRTLKEIIEDTLQESTPVGFCTKTWLRPVSEKKQELNPTTVKESIFNKFNAQIIKLNKRSAIIVFSEQSATSPLSFTDKLDATIVCTLSHELRTLLNGIVGNLELLTEGISKKGQYQVFCQIATGSSHILVNKLNDLFDYFQIHNKEFKLHCGEIELENIFEDIRQACGWLTKQRQIDFYIKKAKSLPRTIVADHSRILQIVINSTMKAIEFTDYGGSIEVYVNRTKCGKIAFKIRSKGTGMYQKLAEHMKSLERLGDRTPHRDIVKNLEAFGLQMTHLICREIGTDLVVKTVEEKYVQLKFEVKDGFPATGDKSTDKERRRSNFLVKNREQENFTAVAACENEKMVFSRTFYPASTMNTKSTEFMFALNNCGSNGGIVGSGGQRVSCLPAIDNCGELEIPIEIPITGRISLPCSLSKHSVTFGTYQMESTTNLTLILPKGHYKKPSNSTPTNIKKRRTTTCAAENQPYLSKQNNCVDDVEICRILIADDNTLNRYVLKALLKRHKLNSIEAANGKEAVILIDRYIKANTLDELSLVFMDLQMPVMNGIESVISIKAMCEKMRVIPPPIIGVSSDSSEQDRRHFFKAGIDDFISKPITEQKLKAILGKYMEKYDSKHCSKD